MNVEDAKKILSGDLAVIAPEILQDVAKIILSELDTANKKNYLLEKKIIELTEKISSVRQNLSLEDLPGEIWKDIEGYDGFYQVSNKGRVKSFKLKSIHIMGQCINNNGYATVTLYSKNLKHTFIVHILVAKAFIPNPKNLPMVHHKDHNKLNNCVENLQWATREENTRYAWQNGVCKAKSGSKNPNAKLNEEQVNFIRENYKPRDKNFGAKSLARQFNLNVNTITKITRGISYPELL